MSLSFVASLRHGCRRNSKYLQIGQTQTWFAKIEASLAATLLVARPFYVNQKTRRRAVSLSVGLVIALLVESGLMLSYSSARGSLMTSIEKKNYEGFVAAFLQTLVVIIIACPLTGMNTYLTTALMIEWRAEITRRLVGKYLVGGPSGSKSHGPFFELARDCTLDNPDQRLCQDIHTLTSTLINILIATLRSTCRVIGFAASLWRISPYICAGLVFYASAITAGAILGFGGRLFKLEKVKTQQEATLRYSLIRVRENAESVAFFQGESFELSRFLQYFSNLLETSFALLNVHCGFAMYTSSVKFLTSFIPVCLAGPRFMRGEIEFGQIAKTEFAFNVIFDGLMLLVNEMQHMAGIAVTIARVGALNEALDQAQGGRALGRWDCICLQENLGPAESGPVLELAGILLRTPARCGSIPQTLLESLSFQLFRDESLLLMGANGVGKSSLLRAIAGLWSDGRGSVKRCGRKPVFFMPQRPYMCLGTLREQLLYPSIGRTDVTEAALEAALVEVNLAHVHQRYGFQGSEDWSNILSLGEQQRLNFARVLLQSGTLRLALLDEGTSACDPNAEVQLYTALAHRLRTYVSVGHRPSLMNFHTHALYLERGNAVRTSCDSVGDTGQPASGEMIPMATFRSRQAANGYSVMF